MKKVKKEKYNDEVLERICNLKDRGIKKRIHGLYSFIVFLILFMY